MAVETTLAVSWEVRQDLADLAAELRRERGGRTVAVGDVIAQLLADRAELRRLTGARDEAGA
jgi:hypothetical protein